MNVVGKQICSPVWASPVTARRLQAATEGIRMDPDLDPNLQHWQDRLDSLQWVIGSILSQIDSVPT